MTKQEITEMYREWRKTYRNHRPNRAIVKMYWEDEGAAFTHIDTISLKVYDCITDVPKDDDCVLWYAGGLKGLLQLTKPNNGSDFVVTEVVQFYREK